MPRCGRARFARIVAAGAATGTSSATARAIRMRSRGRSTAARYYVRYRAVKKSGERGAFGALEPSAPALLRPAALWYSAVRRGRAVPNMKVAVPREIAPGERRVALTPDAAAALVKGGMEVLVEAGAGAGAFHSDAAYEQAGARIAPDARSLYGAADVVLKVQK